MKNALIVDNKPLCPICKHNKNLVISDCFVAKIDNEILFEMIAACRNCNNKIRYFLDCEMENRKVFNLNEVEYKRLTGQDC